MVQEIKDALQQAADPERAKTMKGFFKTKPGQYGEGDVFLGVTVPEQREIAKRFAHVTLEELTLLLISRIHEERLTAWLILVEQFNQGKNQEEIVRFYLANTKSVDNWDLVDLTADKILGRWLLQHPEEKRVLLDLVSSSNLWERRIAMIATFAFIKEEKFVDALQLAELLLKDEHDLIHKAVGWMLREIGKRSLETEETFLKKHYQAMPRTMLRYAIEKFPEEKRAFYMKK